MEAARQRRVLVADDTPAVARRVVELLREVEGVEVVGPVGDGSEALRMFHETAPACVVLDLNMPSLDGLGLLDAIRAEDTQCLLIVLTSHEEPSIRERCVAAGADHFLRKSREFEQVPVLVRAAFARQASLSEEVER